MSTIPVVPTNTNNNTANTNANTTNNTNTANINTTPVSKPPSDNGFMHHANKLMSGITTMFSNKKSSTDSSHGSSLFGGRSIRKRSNIKRKNPKHTKKTKSSQSKKGKRVVTYRNKHHNNKNRHRQQSSKKNKRKVSYKR
jgi:hypothetical protein